MTSHRGEPRPGSSACLGESNKVLTKMCQAVSGPLPIPWVVWHSPCPGPGCMRLIAPSSGDLGPSFVNFFFFHEKKSRLCNRMQNYCEFSKRNIRFKDLLLAVALCWWPWGWPTLIRVHGPPGAVWLNLSHYPLSHMVISDFLP